MNHRATTFLVTVTVAVLSLSALAAETFNGNLLVRPQWTHELAGVTTAKETFSTLFNWDFTSGTTTNQMDQLWVSRRTLTNSANETINIAGGITNSFGTVLTVAEVRMMIVSLPVANLNAIAVGGAAANEFVTWVGAAGDTVTVRPGGIFILVGPDATGYAVSTNGNLKVTNSGTNSITYDIYIGGSSQ